MANPRTTVASISTRSKVRAMLGLTGEETTEEALTGDGFVLAPELGRAYLPVGLPDDDLRHASRSGGELDQARRVLPRPANLDCILVGEGSSPQGFSIETGAQVPIP